MDKDGYNNPHDALRAEYERGFVEGMSHQAKSSVDRAVNAMSKREWIGLTEEDIGLAYLKFVGDWEIGHMDDIKQFASELEAKLKERNT